MHYLNRTLNSASELLTVGRIILLSFIACSVIYTLAVLLVGRGFVPDLASGSLLYDKHGKIVGSSLIAQKFSRAEYFWSRPSATDYNASSSGGSNLSPAGQNFRDKARARAVQLGLSVNTVAPLELVTASGSGLDPHISLSGALAQAERVAKARALPLEKITTLIHKQVQNYPGAGPLLNVLLLNISLDSMEQ